MKRIKYIIIMAAVLVTAVCFMITFSRKNQAGKPDQVSEASFVFADKAESEGDYSYIVQQDTSGGALFDIYRTDSNGVEKVYEKQFSHPTIFWKYGARVYIIQDIHEKSRYRQRFTRYRIRRNLWKSKPMSSKAVWWEPTCRENICGL